MGIIFLQIKSYVLLQWDELAKLLKYIDDNEIFSWNNRPIAIFDKNILGRMEFKFKLSQFFKVSLRKGIQDCTNVIAKKCNV